MRVTGRLGRPVTKFYPDTAADPANHRGEAAGMKGNRGRRLPYHATQEPPPMPVPVEAIQGYLIRSGLKFAINDQGDNGQFMLTFETRRYSNPAGEKSLMVIVTVSENGGHLEIAAVNAYSATDAKDVGKLCEFLMGQNYTTKLLRWELDRCDGEIRALADVAPLDGGVTFEAFMRMLMTFPIVLDSLHPSITKVMTTAKLPPPTRINKRLRDLVHRAGGLDALEKLVRAQEKASRDSAVISPELAAKFGITGISDNQTANPEQATPLVPPPACPPNDNPESPGDRPPVDGGQPDVGDGPCSCGAPSAE
jgi:hypothetical protein